MRLETDALVAFLETGGPALWAIAVLSVLTLAIILWKLWRFALCGAWSTSAAERRVAAACAGNPAPPPRRARSVRSSFVTATLAALSLPDDLAREEVGRLAQRELSRLRRGLRPLELIATIAPLIGLLGTVLGMIDAFQALETSGAQADPAILAGGIWEALLTTAAGMAVAIPAAVALSWFEGIVERVQTDMEDMATRLFTHDAKGARRVG